MKAPRRSLRGPLLAALILLLIATACSRHRKIGPGPGSVQEGVASWYGEPFHGRATASGEVFDMHGVSAAHRTLPLGTLVEVTNLENGRRIELRINDRGPFVGKRILDLSYGAAQRLDMVEAGLARVRIRVLRPGPTGPEARSPQTGPFTVQAGAFSDRDRARARAAELRRRGYPAEVVRRGGLHRIQIGTYERRTAADALVRDLARRGIDALVVGLR